MNEKNDAPLPFQQFAFNQPNVALSICYSMSFS